MIVIDALILSMVEGLTEFIPVSSTAHLVVASHLLGIETSAFTGSFTICIQLGAILAVAVLYARVLIENKQHILKVLAAFVPTAVVGFLVYQLVKNILAEGLSLIAYMLIIGGVIILLFEWWYEEKETDIETIDNLSYREAIALGLFQSIAIIPGVSRSGATIIGGMLLRLKRRMIVEFSFLLAIPTMMAATGYDLLKSASQFSPSEWELLVIGFVGSFIVSILAVRWFLSFVSHYTFSWFGVYRIIVGLFILFFLV